MQDAQKTHLLDLLFKVSIIVVRNHLRESDLLSGGLGGTIRSASKITLHLWVSLTSISITVLILKTTDPKCSNLDSYHLSSAKILVV